MWCRTGSPGGPVLVALHGFGPDHRSLRPMLDPVARERGWQVLYLDLPGMGRSSAAADVRCTDDVFATVRDAVAELAPHGPAALVGDSYGGYLARGLVAAVPSRYAGLALISPVWHPEHDRRTVPEHRVLEDEPGAFDDLPDPAAFSRVAVRRTRAVANRLAAGVVPGLAVADPDALRRIGTSFAGTFPTETRPFPGPALVVTGRQDSSTGYADGWPLLGAYPRATFAVLDGAGHGVPAEQPELVGSLLGEWLGRVDRTLGRAEPGPGTVPVHAELPATVLEIAEPGTRVGPDDPVALLESMKMHIPVPAGRAGTITTVAVAPGDEVSGGDLLFRLRP